MSVLDRDTAVRAIRVGTPFVKALFSDLTAKIEGHVVIGIKTEGAGGLRLASKSFGYRGGWPMPYNEAAEELFTLSADTGFSSGDMQLKSNGLLDDDGFALVASMVIEGFVVCFSSRQKWLNELVARIFAETCQTLMKKRAADVAAAAAAEYE